MDQCAGLRDGRGDYVAIRLALDLPGARASPIAAIPFCSETTERADSSTGSLRAFAYKLVMRPWRAARRMHRTPQTTSPAVRLSASDAADACCASWRYRYGAPSAPSTQGSLLARPQWRDASH